MRPSTHNEIFSETECLSREMLLSYSNGELGPEEVHAVERHLVDCEFCTEALEGLALVAGAAAGMDAMDNRFEAMLAQQQPTAVAPKSAGWKRYGWLAAACVVGIAISLVWFNSEDVLSPDLTAEQYQQKEKPSPKQQATEKPKEDQTSPEEAVAASEDVSDSDNSNSSEQVDKLQSKAEELAKNSASAVESTEVVEEAEAESDLAVVADEFVPVRAPKSLPNGAYFDAPTNNLNQEGAGATSYQWSADSEPAAVEDDEIALDTDVTSEPPFELNGGNLGVADSTIVLSESILSNAFNMSVPVTSSNYTYTATELSNQKLSDPISMSNATSFEIPTPMVGKTDGSSDWADNQQYDQRASSTDDLAMLGNTYRSSYIEGLKVVDYSDVYEDNREREQPITTTGTPAMYERKESAGRVPNKVKARAKVAEQAVPKSYKTQTVDYTYEDYLSMALNDFNAGDYSSAISKFNVIDEHYRSDMNALFYSGLCHYNLGSFVEAEQQFDRVLSSDIDIFHQEARWYKAQALLGQNRPVAAKELLREIVRNGEFYREKAQQKLDTLK